MNDYVSREEVIRITIETGARETQNRVRELKSANVQPVRQGKWVKHINHRYDYDREQGDSDAGVSYTCSLCNLHGFKGWHFCPNCGADMEGNSNDN